MFAYHLFFVIQSISMGWQILISWYTNYFDGLRTIDTFVYWVFPWFVYYWYFGLLGISMDYILLILWYTEYFDWLVTIDTLIYEIFRCVGNYWYYDILSISTGCVPLKLWYAKYSTRCKLPILSYTKYSDVLCTIDIFVY